MLNATIVADAVDHLVRGIVSNPDDVEVAWYTVVVAVPSKLPLTRMT